ncbi:hypothetical protein ACSBR1_036575 [Camellia fascicularis]
MEQVMGMETEPNIETGHSQVQDEMENLMTMETETNIDSPKLHEPTTTVTPPSKSFKEALNTVQRSHYLFDNRVDILLSDEDDDDHHFSIESTLSEHMGIPKVSLPRKFLNKIRMPWKNTLIVRLLGKSIGYKMLCSRAKNIWGLIDEFNAIDLGTNYFLFKFSKLEDYTKVYTGGPWVIMDHYLTV